MRKSRLSKILDYVSVNESSKISTLAEKFYVSEMTIRRDISELEKRNLVVLSKGTVTINKQVELNMNTRGEYSIDVAHSFRLDEKNHIAKKVSTLIKDHEVLMLDNGTTMEQIALHLPKNKKNTIITNNFKAAQFLVLNPNITLILAGGLYHHDTSMMESSESIQLINRFRGTKVFISCSGIHSELGVTCNKMYEIENKRALLESSKERYLVADSSKFGLIHAYHFSDIVDYDYIITDKGITQEWIDYLNEKKVGLIIV